MRESVASALYCLVTDPALIAGIANAQRASAMLQNARTPVLISAFLAILLPTTVQADNKWKEGAQGAEAILYLLLGPVLVAAIVLVGLILVE